MPPFDPGGLCRTTDFKHCDHERANPGRRTAIVGRIVEREDFMVPPLDAILQAAMGAGRFDKRG